MKMQKQIKEILSGIRKGAKTYLEQRTIRRNATKAKKDVLKHEKIT